MLNLLPQSLSLTTPSPRTEVPKTKKARTTAKTTVASKKSSGALGLLMKATTPSAASSVVQAKKKTPTDAAGVSTEIPAQKTQKTNAAVPKRGASGRTVKKPRRDGSCTYSANNAASTTTA